MNADSILVAQPGRLGDMVLTTPLLRELSRCYPGAELSVLCSPDAAPIAASLPFVHGVQSIRGGIASILIARDLVVRPHDIYIDPKDHRSTTSRVLSRRVRARVRVMHPANAGRRAPVLSLPVTTGPRHYADVMLDAVRVLCPEPELGSDTRRPMLVLPDAAVARAQTLRASLGAFVALNLSAGSPTRRLNEEVWKEVVSGLASAGRGVAILSVGHDRAVAARLAARGDSVRAIETRDFMDAAAIVAAATGLVSPDTSLVHVSSAFDVPTVGLYPADEANLVRFAPLATRRATLRSRGADTFAFASEDILGSVAAVFP